MSCHHTEEPAQETNETLRGIKAMLRLRMNGAASAAMRKSGLDYAVNFGLDAVNLREIASRHTPDIALADQLWSHQSRECKILATLLHPRELFSPEKAETWLDGCFTTELIEQLVFNLLQHAPWAPIQANRWIVRSLEALDTHASDSDRIVLVRRATGGFTLALRLLLRQLEPQGMSELLPLARHCTTHPDPALALTALRFSERVELLPGADA